MKIINKIVWNKPDYKNRWGRISDREIDKHCLTNTSSGDIIIRKEQYGRKIEFFVYRIEKVGTLIEGIETLSRQRAIQELKKLNQQAGEK